MSLILKRPLIQTVSRHVIFCTSFHQNVHSMLDSVSIEQQSKLERPLTFSFSNQVLISHETCIFHNLAIEHWLFRHQQLQRGQRALLMWVDSPSVVIGRHQNPWQECNLNECNNLHVKVARRNSGGGTVFHDEQNLNICFFAHRTEYDRKRNLNFLSHTLRKHFHIETEVNCREDLVLKTSGEKVSGTASKLAHQRSYHHCTLLINSDLNLLRACLRKQNNNLISNATKSVRSPVKNLNSICSSLTVKEVMEAVATEYSCFEKIPKAVKLFGNDESMNGLDQIRNELASWSWVYGKSPKFTICHQKLADQLYECKILVEQGKISSIQILNKTKNAILLESQLPSLNNVPLMTDSIESKLNVWISEEQTFKSIFIKELIEETIESAFF